MTTISSPKISSRRPASDRLVTLVVALMAIGETTVGMVILVLPHEVARLLIDAALDARGLIVARMLGVAVLALGITWWMARGDANRLSEYSVGFIVYNLGIGALFGWAALGAGEPALPWSVCVLHLVAGVAFWTLIRRSPSPQNTK